jgi:LysM repeat protein
MKLVVYIGFLFVFSMSSALLAQEEYRSHYVKQGETIFSIAKKYGTTTEAIYKLNPDVKNKVSVNALLIIPQEVTVSPVIQEVELKKHRVKRKETLFSISQKYNVSIDDIKKYNKELYARPIKKGEKIMIPILVQKEIIKEPTTVVEVGSETDNKHTVEAKETKFGIARKYGISITELEALNPNMGDNLQIGTVLIVPALAVTNSATIEEDFDFYEVQPKEGFFRLKVKLGLTEEEIIALNPYTKDGLKDGMILKIPKENIPSISTEKALLIDLETRITDRSEKNLVIMLPFQLNKVDNDSLNANRDLLRKGGALRVALDFYSGVLMAAEFAKDKGISVRIDVFDTEGSDSKTSSLILNHNFSNVDAVIGPLLKKNVERAASMLRETKTPIISPLSNREIKMYSNLFQTLPTEEMLRKSMLDYLIENSGDKNLVLISDTKRSDQKAEILKALPNTTTISPRERGFLYVVDVDTKLVKEKENWIILESADSGIISNVLGLLNGMPEDFKIRLFTLDKNDAYDYHDVSNMHLAKLNFTFPSVNRNYNYREKDPFLVSYKNKYGIFPNRYAVRGFDIGYDILLRLASAEDLYEAVESDYETEYVENKFRYTKKRGDGYQNQASYIIKYMENLDFEIVK